MYGKYCNNRKFLKRIIRVYNIKQNYFILQEFVLYFRWSASSCGRCCTRGKKILEGKDTCGWYNSIT